MGKSPYRCNWCLDSCFNSTEWPCDKCGNTGSNGILHQHIDPALVQQLYEIHYGGRKNMPWYLQ